MFLLFLLLVGGTLFYLARTGRISAPPWASARTVAGVRGAQGAGRAFRPR